MQPCPKYHCGAPTQRLWKLISSPGWRGALGGRTIAPGRMDGRAAEMTILLPSPPTRFANSPDAGQPLQLHPFSREARVLFLSAGNASSDPRMASLLDDSFDWDLLTALGDRENAFPPLWHRIASLGRSSDVPGAVAQDMMRRSLATGMAMQRLERVLTDAVQTLAAANIEVVLLKGAALASSVYPTFADRPMNDIDLLVRGEEGTRAWRHLLDAGWHVGGDAREELYRDHQHLQPLHHPAIAGFRIELHTSLFGAEHPFRFDIASVWQARRASRYGPTASVPDPLHMFLHACVHFAWSHMFGFGAWRCFRDVTVLSEGGLLDWPSMSALAVESRTASAVYWTLRLARRVAGTPVPDSVLESLRPRLPRVLLAVMERHFLHGLLARGQNSPSVKVDRVIWRLALFPRLEEKVSAPWDRNDLFMAALAPEIPMPQRSEAKPRAWRRYLAFVALGVPGARAGPRVLGVPLGI